MPKLPPPPCETPEEVRVLVGVRTHECAVGRHDLGGAHRPRGEAVASAQPAEAATHGVADDADARARARQAREPVGRGRGDDVGPPRPGGDPGRAGRGVDGGGAHARGVDEHAAVGGHGRAVSGGQHPDAPPLVAGEPHRGADVQGGLGHDDRGRGLVDVAVPGRAALVVPGVAEPQRRRRQSGGHRGPPAKTAAWSRTNAASERGSRPRTCRTVSRGLRLCALAQQAELGDEVGREPLRGSRADELGHRSLVGDGHEPDAAPGHGGAARRRRRRT